MHEAILVACRRHAQALIQKTRTEKARLMREHAECVLRTEPSCSCSACSKTSDADKRRQILRQAFSIA